MQSRMSRVKWVIAAAMLLLLCGCPYESRVPLSRCQDAQIDERLIGMWRSETADPKESGTIIVAPFNEHEFLIVVHEEDKEGDDFYRAFVTDVGGEKFLNVQEIKASTKQQAWNFVNYHVAGDRLRVRIVEDKLFKATKAKQTTDSLYGFIGANIKNKDLYDENDDHVLKRVERRPEKPLVAPDERGGESPEHKSPGASAIPSTE